MSRTALAIAIALASCGSETEPTSKPSGSVAEAQQAGAAAVPASGPNNVPRKMASSSTGCSAKETTIFACTVENGKTLAVCSRGGDTATYRYGSDRTELELEGGSWARVGYSGGGELQIAFDNAGTSYVVFSRTVRTNFKAGEPNNPAISDGVVVLQNGRFQGIQLCRADSDASYYGENSEAAMQLLPQSNELFTDETARAEIR